MQDDNNNVKLNPNDDKDNNLTDDDNNNKNNNGEPESINDKEKNEVIRGNFYSSSIDDYNHKQPIFWDVFDELSKDNDDNNSNGLVDHEKLTKANINREILCRRCGYDD